MNRLELFHSVSGTIQRCRMLLASTGHNERRIRSYSCISSSRSSTSNSTITAIHKDTAYFYNAFSSSLQSHTFVQRKSAARNLSSSPGTTKPPTTSSHFKEVQEVPGKPPRRQKVPISKTPRGQAAARAKLVDDSSTGPIGIHTNAPSTYRKEVDLDNHAQNLTHFIRGGTPSDPVPPPFRLADYGDDSLYTLVLLRHGESEWNSLNRYTGWCDVNLTETGRLEARAAGRLLKENGIELDHVFTSVLKRANFTTNMALNTAGQHWVPVTKTWRLNERHYGALQGYNKDTAYEELGIDQELVMEMRRSYDTRPPIMTDDHPYWHGKDRRLVSCSFDLSIFPCLFVLVIVHTILRPFVVCF